MYPAPYPSPFAVPVRPRFRDSRQLVRTAVVLWVMASLVELIIMFVEADRSADRLARYRAGEAPVTTLDDTFRYNALIGGSSALAGALAIAGLVLVIVATYRLAKNHQAFGRPGTRWTPGWAIAGWLIPLASSVIPYLQLRDLWRGSDPDLGLDAYGWTSRRSHRAIWVALALSISTAALGVLVGIRIVGASLDSFGTLGDRAEYRVSLAEATADARTLQTLTAIFGLAATVLAAWLLTKVADRQQFLAVRLQLTGPGSPAFTSPAFSPPAFTSAAPSGSPGAPPQPWPTFPPGWFPDPWGRFQLRWWDGTSWTAHVATGANAAYDPLNEIPPAPPS